MKDKSTKRNEAKLMAYLKMKGHNPHHSIKDALITNGKVKTKAIAGQEVGQL